MSLDMVLYPFVASLTLDASSGNVVGGATGEVYAKADTTFTTPLAAVDASGNPVTLTSNANGVLPSFYVDGHTSVNWVSGSWVFPLVTSEPVEGPEGPAGVSVNGATATGDDLVFSLSNGATTAPVKLPTGAGGSDAGVASYITTPGTETATALSATIAEEVEASPTIAGKLDITSARSRLGNKWAVLSDSIGDGGWSGVIHSDKWPTYAALYSKGKIQIVANASVSGNTTAQMLARVQADVITKAPQVCVVSGGTNDISQGVTLATYKSNIGSIVAALRAANIAPVLATITPNAVSAARTASTGLWNQWLRRYAAEQQIPLIDFYAMMVNPANGQFKTGFNSGDNIHPGAEGYRAMGEYAVTVMTPHLQPAALPLGVDAGDTYNLLPSPTFMTDGGGGLAPGWVGIRAGAGTRTFSLVDDAAIVGKWQQTVATAWTADVGVGAYNNTDLANKFVAGDKVAVSGLLSVPSLDPASTIVVEFKANPVTAWLVVNKLTRPLPGIVSFYGEYTMPSGFTGYEVDAYLHNPTGGTNTGTIKIAQCSVYNLTKHGI